MPLDIGKRLAAARAADAPELGQSHVRLTIVPIIQVYFLVSFLWDGVLDRAELGVLLLGFAVVFLDVAHLSWILWRPGVNQMRRRLAVVWDMGAITLLMMFSGEPGVMLYGLYPWVVLGNGFRFGRWYLHYAQVLALAGFTTVWLLSPFWSRHTTLGAALLAVLIAVPWYVSLLLAGLHRANQRLREARREAEAANAAKTKFLAAASHDLRQPVQALSMYVSVLEERVKDAGSLRVVDGIQLSVKTLERLFDSLLDISKIESGIIKPSPIAFPLMPLIDRVVAAETPLAVRKGLDVRVVRTSASVTSDPVLLERMLKNLLTNAIRYTERGGIVVGCRRPGRGRLRLEVVDSGIGIPADEHARIFDEYYQRPGASAQGVGLGLPIVKGLGDLLGHAVTVSSTPGRGSVFSIEMDRAPDVLSLPAFDLGSFPRPLLGVGVVLVDDDAEIRSSMRLLLESWGCRCIVGATGAEAADGLRAQAVTPDALIVDYLLAGPATGLQVIDALRAEFGGDLPALVITGTPNALPPGQRPAKVSLAVKPVPPGKLRAFLSQAARRSDPTSAPRAPLAGRLGRR
jgi:signal transduction histidine kinase/CheY-like chemotaxis protein